MSMADRDGKIWMDGDLVDWRDAKIHVLTHTLHYGCGAFEGVRAYDTVERHGHIPPATSTPQRLFNSAKILRMTIPVSRSKRLMRGPARTVVRENKLASCYLRPAGLDRLREARGLAASGNTIHAHDRRLALGRLPRRGRHEARHPGEDLELTPATTSTSP